jgi:acetolactate synthase-1/2/3 large subunit
VERAARLFADARRPILLAGGGVHLSQAAETLAAFAEALSLPVAHTMSGKGAIACTSALSAGLFGRYDRIANALIAEADLILVAGCKLGEIATRRYTVPPHGKRIVHIDIEPGEIGRTVAPEIALWGDVRETIRDLGAALAADAGHIKARQAAYAAEVAQRMAVWRAGAAGPRLGRDAGIDGAPDRRFNTLMPADGILVADGGFAAHWAGLLYNISGPAAASCPTAALPPSATASPARWAPRWPHPAAPSSA